MRKRLTIALCEDAYNGFTALKRADRGSWNEFILNIVGILPKKKGEKATIRNEGKRIT
jgi:predicted CopG family antitoxin